MASYIIDRVSAQLLADINESTCVAEALDLVRLLGQRLSSQGQRFAANIHDLLGIVEPLNAEPKLCTDGSAIDGKFTWKFTRGVPLVIRQLPAAPTMARAWLAAAEAMSSELWICKRGEVEVPELKPVVVFAPTTEYPAMIVGDCYREETGAWCYEVPTLGGDSITTDDELSDFVRKTPPRKRGPKAK